jgi:hypothetical protein
MGGQNPRPVAKELDKDGAPAKGITAKGWASPPVKAEPRLRSLESSYTISSQFVPAWEMYFP